MRRVAFPIVVLAVFAVWGGLCAIVWLRQADRAVDEFAARASRFVASVQADIAEVARVGSQDVLLLARSAAGLEHAGSHHGADVGVEQLLTAYVEARPSVFQARLIGPDGREQVRVERTGETIRVADSLQDKEDRHYFYRARDLAAGKVYVSPLDLNVENGRIELPPRPTLRFSTPLRSAQTSQLVGVVVINRDAKELIDRVGRARDQLVGMLVLVHEDGVYVSHPDPSREWDGAPAHGLGRDYPGVARWLAATGGGGTFRGSDVVAVAGALTDASLPRALLVATDNEALAAQAHSFLPLAIASASIGVVIALALVFAWRHRRLAAELARETALRRQIAAREKRLEETQERLVASARLAALAESAAALAHELRNPLGAIVSSAALLRRDPQLDADSRTLMEIVLGECERLERSVADFLDLGRRPASWREPVDLAAVVREVVALAALEPSLDGEVDVSVGELSSRAPAVLADPDEVRQVLWNLLSNAGKATRRNGGKAVIVHVRETTLDSKPATLLEVEDEGPGLHSPGDALPAPPPDGHGLGLIVAAGIIARSGGRFELQPRVNRPGARARVILPGTSRDVGDGGPGRGPA